MEIKENPNQGVYVKDVSMFIAKNEDDIGRALATGNKNRVVGETQMNVDSSRSHCLFSIYVET